MVLLIRRFLPAYQAAGLVDDADLRMLCTLRERRQARRWARSAGGRPLARAMVAYQLAPTQLALAPPPVRRGGAPPARVEEPPQGPARGRAAARPTHTP